MEADLFLQGSSKTTHAKHASSHAFSYEVLQKEQ